MIFQATEQLRPEVYYRIEDEPEKWKEDVYDRSCEILLQMASPDALIRLQKSRLADDQKKLSGIYFFEQCHESLLQFLKNHLENAENNPDGLLMQVCIQSSHCLLIAFVYEIFACTFMFL